MINKTIEQIQEENRKAIILANNPKAKSYKEALEMEHMNQDLLCLHQGKVRYYHNIKNVYKNIEIIGRPLTLSRVLIALEKQFNNEYHKMRFQDNKFMFICARDEAIQFYWDLKNTLEEQSEETQRGVNRLLNK